MSAYENRENSMPFIANQKLVQGNDVQLKILTVSFMLFFILNPTFDFISTLLTDSNSGFNRITLFSRGLFTLIASIFALALAFKKQKTLSILLLPVAVTLLSIFTWCLIGAYDINTAFETINVVFKALSFFFFCIAFKYIFKNSNSTNLIETIVKLSFIAYTTSIILGPLLGIESFKSYGEVRFGYKGIILAQNEASALLLIGLLFFGYKVTLKRSDKIDIIGLLSAAIAAFLIGTKAAVIIPVAVFSIILIARSGFIKSAPFVLFIFVAFPAFIYALTLFSTAAQDVIDSTTQYLTYQLTHSANDNILTLLLSGRDDKLQYAWENIVDENPFYLIFGGYPIGLYSIELDLFDLAFLLGIPTLTIYLINLKNAFLADKKGISRRYYILSFILVLAISNSAGHLLTSALALPYLAFFCMYGSIKTQRTRTIPC